MGKSNHRRVVIACACFVLAAWSCPWRAEASVLTLEQKTDSAVLTVFHSDTVTHRVARPGQGKSALFGLADDAGVLIDAEGITVLGKRIPWSGVTVASEVRQPERGWSVTWDTLASGQLANDDRCGAAGPMTVGQDDFLFGSLFTWAGSTTVAGEVSGDVICIGGPVVLLPSAVVRGSVMAVGGTVSQQAPAKVYGGVFSDVNYNFHPVEVSREWEYQGERYRWRPTFTYDKADGARAGFGVEFQDSWLTPRIGLWSGYAVQSKTWQYRVSFEQRVSTARDVRLGGEYLRRTDTEDELFVQSLENTLVAVLANEDYRDYFGRQGGRLWVAALVRERHTATIEYENYDYRWREAAPRLWSLFWSARDFRRNFGALEGVADHLLERDAFEGKVSLARFSCRIAPPQRDRYVTGVGYSFDGFWEIAGGALKGNFDFSRLFARATGWYEFAGRHRVLVHAFAGRATRDTPAPKLFYLGGPAGLRGYPVKHLVGNEAMLATVEYATRFWKNKITDASLVLFYDLGRASFHRPLFVRREFKSDIGVALDFGGGFRLAVAKALEESDLEPTVTVRVKAGR